MVQPGVEVHKPDVTAGKAGHGLYTAGETMAIRVLVVDDEKDIVELVRYHAAKAGFECVAGGDGPTALRLVRELQPDVVILDLMLPGLDGLQVCRRLREDPATARLPIIMLTAKAEEVDRILGLELGADDYVVKPFSPRELMARVRAVLRRTREPDGAPVRRVGTLELDEGRHRVTVAGSPVELTAKEYALLEHLMRHPNQVLTRTMIAEHVWNYDFDNATNVIDVHIRNLRRKIDDPFPMKLIHTVRGAGYRISSRQPE